MTLSVVIITYNEEQNIGRTLASVQELVRSVGGEIIVVDSGSTDRTRDIAQSYGAKVFVEPWKGFAAQKNSAIEKAAGDWVLSLDADEEVSKELQSEMSYLFVYFRCFSLIDAHQGTDSKEQIRLLIGITGLSESTFNDAYGDALDAWEHRPYTSGMPDPSADGLWIPRRNMFLGRGMKHGGFWPDSKLRLFRHGAGRVEDRAVHETIKVSGKTSVLRGALLHHAYPTLDIYLEHMRRYADLSAEMVRHKPRPVLLLNRWLNPPLTFLYNYVFRLGFLDGREGFLLHWNHSRYVSWKYAKALELSRKNR